MLFHPFGLSILLSRDETNVITSLKYTNIYFLFGEKYVELAMSVNLSVRMNAEISETNSIVLKYVTTVGKLRNFKALFVQP